MRLPRLRFTLRWVMVAVAVAAATCWVERLRACRLTYQARARFHGERQAIALNDTREALFICGGDEVRKRASMSPEGFAAYKADIHKLRAKRLAHHAVLRHKYELATRYPWLPIEPDPPEPTFRSPDPEFALLPEE